MERYQASEGFHVGASAELADFINRHTLWTVEKRHGDFGGFVDSKLTPMQRDGASAEDLLVARAYWERYWHENVSIYGREFCEGNILVNSGLSLIWNATIGTAVTYFSNANARLGVSTNSLASAAAVTDTNLGSTLASTNQARNLVNATYPTVSNGVISFQATFSTGQANFTWADVGTFNQAAEPGGLLNRRVPASNLGTKTAGASWTLTETITLS